LLGGWSFDENIIESMIDKKSIVEYAPETKTAGTIKDVWQALKGFLVGDAVQAY
jgi:hypothetical protein